MNTQQILTIASRDAFAWNPYSENRGQKLAGRAKKKGLLCVWFKAAPNRVWLRLTEAGVAKLDALEKENGKVMRLPRTSSSTQETTHDPR